MFQSPPHSPATPGSLWPCKAAAAASLTCTKGMHASRLTVAPLPAALGPFGWPPTPHPKGPGQELPLWPAPSINPLWLQPSLLGLVAQDHHREECPERSRCERASASISAHCVYMLKINRNLFRLFPRLQPREQSKHIPERSEEA